MKMNLKYLAGLVVVLLIADQVLKIWIKTHFALGEGISVFPDWFQLRFIENPGAAFGMRLMAGDGYDWGKLILGLFRIAASCGIAYLIYYLNRLKETPRACWSAWR